MPWPSVAVVVPNHRRVSTALYAIRSAIQQEYSGKLRVYLVYERHSRAQDLLESLPPQVEAIDFTSRARANPIAAKRNAALEACNEDLVAFLDDDDVWHPCKILTQVSALKAVPQAIGCSTGHVTFIEDVRWPDLRSAKPTITSRSAVLRASKIVTSSMLVDGQTVRALRFDERIDWVAVEDFHLWNRLHSRGPIVHVPDPLVAIRINPWSSSRQNRSQQHLKTLAVLRDLASAERNLDLLGAAAIRATAIGLSARGAIDSSSELMLRDVLDGHLFGPMDRTVAAAIRAAWHSRRIVPALHVARDRLSRFRRRGPDSKGWRSSR